MHCLARDATTSQSTHHYITANKATKMEMNPMTNKVDATALYDAAMRGDTETLQGLLRSDTLLLRKLPLSSFTETPLHTSVLAGHLDFSRALLRHEPRMAMEVDASNCTPLHLASAAGQAEMVRVLLGAEGGSDACSVRDEDGRFPLHLATMRGRSDVVRELVGARPESLLVKLDDGDTVLHLCVKYNHLESLKVLVEMIISSGSNGKSGVIESVMIGSGDESIVKISSGDGDGNTILHVAAMFKQVQTTSYLISLPSMEAAVNSLNGFGSTALDCLELSPKDFKSLRIRELLVEAGGKRAKELTNSSRIRISTYHDNDDHLPPTDQNPSIALQIIPSAAASNIERCKTTTFLDHDTKWMEDMRGSLLVMAALIAQMSFQAANTPPGGVWQENVTSSDMGLGCNNSTSVCYAGTSVHGYRTPSLLYVFTGLNTVAFGASVSVMLMIIGFPRARESKYVMRMMALAMCLALFCVSLAFTFSAMMVTPTKDDTQYKVFILVVFSLAGGVGTGAFSAHSHLSPNLDLEE